MSKEKTFIFLGSKYPGLSSSLLDNDELKVLGQVINWVIEDAGEENGMEILTEVFLNIDIDNLKLLISIIKNELENEIESVVIPNAIGFILKIKEVFISKRK